VGSHATHGIQIPLDIAREITSFWGKRNWCFRVWLQYVFQALHKQTMGVYYWYFSNQSMAYITHSATKFLILFWFYELFLNFHYPYEKSQQIRKFIEVKLKTSQTSSFNSN
jgi:hypothetical protein